MVILEYIKLENKEIILINTDSKMCIDLYKTETTVLKTVIK